MQRRQFLAMFLGAAAASAAGAADARPFSLEAPPEDDLLTEIKRGGRGGGRGRGRARGRGRGWGWGPPPGRPRGRPFQGGGFCPPGHRMKGWC